MPPLDGLLKLVVAQESHGREVNLSIADLSGQVSRLDSRLVEALSTIQHNDQHNPRQELDLARQAICMLVQELRDERAARQELQQQLRASQQEAAQQASDLTVLQADMAAVRSRIHAVAGSSSQAVDELASSTRREAEQQRADAEEQLQSLRRELDSKHSQALHAARAELQDWGRAELLHMAQQLKAVVQGCKDHQAQVGLQHEALQQQWDTTSAALSALQEDSRCSKQHAARLQQQLADAEERQHAAELGPLNMAVVLQQTQGQLQQLEARLDARLAKQDADVAEALAVAHVRPGAAASNSGSSAGTYLTRLLGPAAAAAPPAGGGVPPRW